MTFQVAAFARVDNIVFEHLKLLRPTFILKASAEVPKRWFIQNERQLVSEFQIVLLKALDALHEPIMSVTMIMPGQTYPLTDPYEIKQLIGSQIDL